MSGLLGEVGVLRERVSELEEEAGRVSGRAAEELERAEERARARERAIVGEVERLRRRADVLMSANDDLLAENGMLMKEGTELRAVSITPQAQIPKMINKHLLPNRIFLISRQRFTAIYCDFRGRCVQNLNPESLIIDQALEKEREERAALEEDDEVRSDQSTVHISRFYHTGNIGTVSTVKMSQF